MSRTHIVRRHFLAGSAALGAGVLGLAGHTHGATDAQKPSGSALAVVSIAQGTLHGSLQGKVAAFKRVPYAANPFIAANRFKAPQPAPTWSGERDAASYGPMPPQPSRARGGGLAGEGDDLTLNIWAPAGAQGAPVLVWFPGGGFYRVDAAEG